MLMKKPLRYVLSVMLMLALMLSMGTAAFADKTDSGLPVEYVSYGVGLSDEPGVDKHGLGDDGITIDGVSWKPKMSEDKLYVHILDLAAAKLLRGCTDEAKELGIDYAKLYIENGLIQVKEDVPSAEAEELRAKLDKLTYAAVIGVVAGDVFDVGNGGEVKLQVVVAGFVTGAAKETAAEQETVKSVLEVKGIGTPYNKGEVDLDEVNNTNFAGVTTTTIYVAYGGATRYEYSASPLSSDGLDGGELQPDYEPKYKLSERMRSGRVGVANAEGDENKYYIKIVGIGNEPKFIPVDDLASMGDDAWDAMKNIAENGVLATEIIVATDQDGNNIVMTIKLTDDTADLNKLRREQYPPAGEVEPAEGEDGGDISLSDAAPGGEENEEPGEGSGEGESNEPSDKYHVVSGTGEGQYDPNDIIEVKPTGDDTADVTVRDTVIGPPLYW